MVDRDFTYGKETMRYAVGQGMGFYSSWAVFAYSHHKVIHYAAARASYNPQGNYSLLGDDVSLYGSKRFSDSYRQVINKLGVEINTTKSTYGFGGEFAKRLFHRGHEVTPISARILQSVVVNHLTAKEVYNMLEDRRPHGTPSLALGLDTYIKILSR
jgi:hypothetical protein